MAPVHVLDRYYLGITILVTTGYQALGFFIAWTFQVIQFLVLLVASDKGSSSLIKLPTSLEVCLQYLPRDATKGLINHLFKRIKLFHLRYATFLPALEFSLLT